jgi:hypothetical protein
LIIARKFPTKEIVVRVDVRKPHQWRKLKAAMVGIFAPCPDRQLDPPVLGAVFFASGRRRRGGDGGRQHRHGMRVVRKPSGTP